MQQLKRIFAFASRQQWSRKHYLWDTLMAVFVVLLVTLCLTALHFYAMVAAISLVYLLVVLALASTRGLYAAVLASVVAFLAFDFFLVEPLYKFTVAHPEEWLALVTFLCTAIITGQLTAALRARAEQARARARETRILYELLRDANNEEDLDHQLRVVARTVVEVFASYGVQDCLLLLPDEGGKPNVRVSALHPQPLPHLTVDALTTAAWALREGQPAEFYAGASLNNSKARGYASRVVIRSTNMGLPQHYLNFFPLKTGQKAVGVLCLVMKEDLQHFARKKRLGSEVDRSDPNSTFFWAFLDQAAVMIERARLRRESLQIEVLRRTDALRAALISSVSHDLRTPLTSIKAAASSLLQEDVQWNEEEQRSFTLAIEHEADRLNRLVENLLDLSRIEGGALQPEKEWYPIDVLLHDVLSRMQPFLQDRQVLTNLPASLPPVELDYMMIDQVLTNLLENVLRYTPAGSPIEISATPTATEIFFSVSDRGPGIPPRDLERVFDKFYRVLESTRTIAGTGVGLAVCRGLIDAHGGRIWAENRPGGGAVFRFTLPLHAADSAPTHGQHEQSPSAIL